MEKNNRFKDLALSAGKLATNNSVDAKEKQAAAVISATLQDANEDETYNLPFLVILNGRKEAVEISGLAHHFSSDITSFVRAAEITDALYVGNALEKTSTGTYLSESGAELTYFSAGDFTTTTDVATGAEFDLAQAIHCFIKSSSDSVMPDLEFAIIIESLDNYKEILTGVLNLNLEKGEAVEFALLPYFRVGGMPINIPFKLSKASGSYTGSIVLKGKRDLSDTKIRLSLISAKKMAKVIKRLKSK